MQYSLSRCQRDNQRLEMYDGKIGQVFEERIAPIQRLNDDRNWHQRTPTTLCQKYMSSGTVAYSNYCKLVEQNRCPKIVKGPRKLLQISISVLISNLQHLPSSTLRRIPVHLLNEVTKSVQERFTDLGPLGCIPLDILEIMPLSAVEGLWEAINQRSQLNLDTWKGISKRLLSEKCSTVKDLGLRRYRQVIESPNSNLSFYTEPITSPSFEFLTSLSIAVWAPMRDLVKLADIVNLGILQIYESDEPRLEYVFEKIVPDKLVRAWAILATEKKAFSVLRVLRFDLLEDGLTDSSLRYLNSFPALGLVSPGKNGMSEGVSDKARELGWQVRLQVSGLIFENIVPFSLYKKSRTEGDESMPDAFSPRNLWYASTRYQSTKNPTVWGGCEVTELPSKSRNELLDALDLSRPPIRKFSAAILDGIMLKSDLTRSTVLQGETWPSIDWNLFCESIQSERAIDGNYWDQDCLDGFYDLSFIRLDNDLRNAGVENCGLGVASIGHVFKSIISTTPMVSILLGKRIMKREKIIDSYHPHRRFFLAKMPDSVSNQNRPTYSSTQVRPSAAPSTRNKRPGSTPGRMLRRPKVQKFEDFFGEL